jgi:hypothetical protein
MDALLRVCFMQTCLTAGRNAKKINSPLQVYPELDEGEGWQKAGVVETLHLVRK